MVKKPEFTHEELEAMWHHMPYMPSHQSELSALDKLAKYISEYRKNKGINVSRPKP